MKPLAPLLVAACVAIAAPAFSQPRYDPDAEAQRRRAELQAWGARADVQAAEAARAEAEARYRLRAVEAARNQGRVPGQALPGDSVLTTDRLQVDAAGRRADDAYMRELDAELRSLDAWLDQARPQARPQGRR